MIISPLALPSELLQLVYSAPSRNRTDKPCEREILSLQCLPISPSGRYKWPFKECPFYFLLLWRRWELHPRSFGYEPNELLLLYPASVSYSFNITYQTLFVKWILSVSNRLPSACKADVHPFTPKTRTVSDMLIRRVFRGATSFTQGLTSSW